MPPERNHESLQFCSRIGIGEVRSRFDGGAITTDAVGLLLRETQKRTGILAQVRQAWPKLRISVRDESGFYREEPTVWCVQNRVDSRGAWRSRNG